MAGIDYKGLADSAREKAIDDVATRIQQSGTDGCKIMAEIRGMNLSDLKDVLSSAQKKENENFAKSGTLPFVEFNFAPYKERISHYGEGPDGSRDQATVAVNALKVGNKGGMESIVTLDTRYDPGTREQPGKCTDLK
jgi:hypothetical protein